MLCTRALELSFLKKNVLVVELWNLPQQQCALNCISFYVVC